MLGSNVASLSFLVRSFSRFLVWFGLQAAGQLKRWLQFDQNLAAQKLNGDLMTMESKHAVLNTELAQARKQSERIAAEHESEYSVHAALELGQLIAD